MHYINFQMIDENVLSSNSIAGFFDRGYIWKETMS